MVKAIIFIYTVLALITSAVAPSFSEEYSSDSDLRTFEGRVVSVNTSQSSIMVKGAVDIEFPVSPGTQLIRETSNIKLNDIDVGDYVVVDYQRAASQSRAPLKVSKITLVYKGNSR